MKFKVGKTGLLNIMGKCMRIEARDLLSFMSWTVPFTIFYFFSKIR